MSRSRRQKKVIRINKARLLLFVSLVALIIVALIQGCTSHTGPVNADDLSYIDVVIPENSNARQVAAILAQNNLVYSEKDFLNYCRTRGLDDRLKAGHYKLSRSQSLKEIIKSITEGQVITLSFTIPEGYSVKEIGNLLVKKKLCSETEWQQAINKSYDFGFLQDIPPEVEKERFNQLEGFLFPDTYYVSKQTTAEQIIEMMLKNFEKIWYKEFAQQAEKKNKSVYDVITLASMVEKEAMIAEERPRIAGVIENRLNKGMLLQIDATVLYSLQENKELVTLEDLEVDSPYNTYKNLGLPPGPITCPGREAIRAVLNPEEHNYYFYVAKGDGSHHFSITYNEHLQAINRYSK